MTFVESEFGAANSDRQSATSSWKTAFGGQRLSTSEIIPAQANLFAGAQLDAAKAALLESELGFYQGYRGWLNPFPTVGETAALLDDELAKLGTTCEAWQVREVMTNVFLLGCTLLNSVDDYVRGPTLRMPKKASRLPLAWLVQEVLEASEASTAILRWSQVARAKRWKQQWQSSFDAFLEMFVCEEPPRSTALVHTAGQLSSLLLCPLPTDLQAEHIRVPSAFRKQDLSHFDILALGRKFVCRFSDRQQPILIVGLRTAGSYFAPLLRAFLKFEGYQRVGMVTIRPKKGLAAWERAELTRCARARYLVVAVDEPPFSGSTIGQGVEQIRKTGFQAGKLVLMFPVRPASRDWRAQAEATGYLDEVVLCLEPEEWYKHRLLAPEIVERRLQEYLLRRGYSKAAVITSSTADEFNARLLDASVDNPRARLKRVFEVRLETREGHTETRYVLAKSVGWGLFGYSAFIAGCRLVGLVPPLLGLRDSILYTEWIPQTESADARTLKRSQWIERAADYVAARVNTLRLAADPTPSLGVDSQHEGYRVLAKVLSKAYGSRMAAKLMNGRVRQKLARLTSPLPTLIDGKMSASEWITGPTGPLKSDFEHHGFGKDEVNVSEPVYDLADVVLQLGLSPIEEHELVSRYVDATGDIGARDRLFFGKLLAGIWSLESSLDALLKQLRSGQRVAELNGQYLRAWDFLTRESARFCGGFCHRPQSARWQSPLVVLDVDGVLDRRIFGFPTTTAAGIRALRCLHAHGYAVALDTARSAREVKDYCSAYGFVGGVAEYGSYVFDAVANAGRTLVSAEVLEQLDELRRALGQLSGVFVNDGYEYSIRAYTYDRNGMIPLPSLTVPNLISRLNLDRLCSHQTMIDTTIVAKDVDKGRGLSALLAWVGGQNLETVAVGDSEPDLPMFRVANRSFAPGKIGRPDLMEAVGGQVMRDPSQRGLLAIARSLVHPDGSRCPRCPPKELESTKSDLFLDLLEAADETPSVLLLKALLHPKAFQVFVQT